jgi:hypothetical protein
MYVCRVVCALNQQNIIALCDVHNFSISLYYMLQSEAAAQKRQDEAKYCDVLLGYTSRIRWVLDRMIGFISS